MSDDSRSMREAEIWKPFRMCNLVFYGREQGRDKGAATCRDWKERADVAGSELWNLKAPMLLINSHCLVGLTAEGHV